MYRLKPVQALLNLSREARRAAGPITRVSLRLRSALNSSLQPLLVAVVTFVSAYTICSLLKAIEELVFILPT